MTIKCLNSSENRGWVYIIGVFGLKKYSKVCVSLMVVPETVSVLGNIAFLVQIYWSSATVSTATIF